MNQKGGVIMDQEKYCQSCGMPMNSDLYGTNADNSPSDEYCTYCFQAGKFTDGVLSLSEYVDLCLPHMIAAHPEMSPENARAHLENYLPTLKRWQK